MEEENIRVDVNAVVDMLRDTKALYSILVKYEEEFPDLQYYFNPEEFARLFNYLFPVVKYKLKRLKRQEKQEKRKLSSNEIKVRIYNEVLNEVLTEEYPPHEPELARLVTYVLVDFIRAKGSYYQSKRAKIHIVDISKGSVVLVISAALATIACGASLAIAYKALREGRESIEVDCLRGLVRLKIGSRP